MITLDADFHAILARDGATRPSVIRVRVEGLQTASLVERLGRVLRSCERELAAGAAVTVEASRARVRRLPLS